MNLSLKRIFNRITGRTLQAMADQVRALGLTYLSTDRLSVLIDECKQSNRAGRGAYVEAGCALGGSTALIAQCRRPGSDLLIFDTFEGMPEPTENDSADVHARFQVIRSGQSTGINGMPYYGYRTDLEAHLCSVIDRLVSPGQRLGVRTIRGLVQDTMNIQGPVAFAHVDVDWYDPVLTCSERLFPQLMPGGAIIFDDYSDYDSCRRAVDDYFRGRTGVHQAVSRGGSLVIRKVDA